MRTLVVGSLGRQVGVDDPVELGVGRIVEHRRAPSQRAVDGGAVGKGRVDLILARIGAHRMCVLLKVDQHLQCHVALFATDRRVPITGLLTVDQRAAK